MPESNVTVTSPAGVPASELPTQARLRLEHAGQWVAWSEDFTRVVAAGDSFEAMRGAARQLGVTGTVSEWIPPVPVQPLDGIA
jgi:hypothetical protein